LLGTWPIQDSGEPEGAATAEYIGRIQVYMGKALHEAKLNTSWIQPNEEWDAAMRDFIAKILDPSPRNKFLPVFLPVVQEIARLGVINSLTQTLLKLTSPGVPDIYQGNEILDYSLVDPDNRRPVDYKRRRQLLEALPAATPDTELAGWPHQNVFNPASSAIPTRTCRSFPPWRIFAAWRERNICGVLRQFRPRIGRQMDRGRRAASVLAHRFSADW